MSGQSIKPLCDHCPIDKQVGKVWLGVADSRERHDKTKYQTIV